MYESEYKRLLTKNEFETIFQRLGQNAARILQINYYYDTPDLHFNRLGVTIRIRQKEGSLKGTVKKHLSNDSYFYSSEDDFDVDKLPLKMTCEDSQIFLMGQMVTERFVIHTDDNLVIMLDKNLYLGIIDYEMEVEFSEDSLNTATQFMCSIDSLIAETQANERSKSLGKSQRFFEALNKLNLSI